MKKMMILIVGLFAIWFAVTGYADTLEEKAAFFRANLAKAEKGDAKAQLQVGNCYLDGFGVQLDDEKGIDWMYKAAQQGYVQAQRELGMRFIELSKYVSKEENQRKFIYKGIQFLTMAADNKDDYACYLLGEFYTTPGEYYNLIEGVEWYRKGANLGNENCKKILKR